MAAEEGVLAPINTAIETCAGGVCCNVVIAVLVH